MSLKCYIGLLSTEVNCILCEQGDFHFSLRLFVSAAVRIRMGSLKLLKTFDAHPSEARALQLSDLTTAQSGKRQLFLMQMGTGLIWFGFSRCSRVILLTTGGLLWAAVWTDSLLRPRSIPTYLFLENWSQVAPVYETDGENWGLRWASHFLKMGWAEQHQQDSDIKLESYSTLVSTVFSVLETFPVILTTIFPSLQNKIILV